MRRILTRSCALRSVIFSTTLVAGLVVSANGHASEVFPQDAYLLPYEFEVTFDPSTQQEAYHDFMWRSFIALSWPADQDGLRGEPDTEKSILDQKGSGTLSPAVWETYREPFEIFLSADEWVDYPEWNDAREYPVTVPAGAKALWRYAKIEAEDFTADINQPDFFVFGPTGPLVDRNGNYVRYEVSVNQAYFTYISEHNYYQAPEQVRAVQAYLKDDSDPTGFQPPPTGQEDYVQALPLYARQGLVEIKAAWRVLVDGKDDKSRYFHRPVVPIDVFGKAGEPVTMGLVAFHILRFTPNGRIAATFEQVNNVVVGRDAPPGLLPSFNSGAEPNAVQKRFGFEGDIPKPISKDNPPSENPTPIDIYRVTPLPGDVQEINAKYQAMLGDSALAFYQLINTQNRHIGFDTTDRVVNGPTGPITGVYTNTSNLINTALESYTQANYSCILCHSQARPLGVGPASREIDHFKILSFLLQAAKSPPTSTESTQSGN